MNAKIKHLQPARYTAEEVREIGSFFRQMIDDGLTITHLAYSAGVSNEDFTAFLAGKVDASICNAIDALQCRILAEAEATEFVNLPCHKPWWNALEFARASRPGLKSEKAASPRGVALIFGGAGLGKTTLIERYAESNNRFNDIHQLAVLVIEVPGGWRSRKIMLEEISKAISQQLGLVRNHQDPENYIKTHMPFGGIIIFDQAHRLSTTRLDELTYLTDQLSIAIGLVGNLTGYVELCKRQLDSITRRVNGRPTLVEIPSEADVIEILRSSKISGAGILETAKTIGINACGIDRLFKTCKAAKIKAAALSVPVDMEIFQSAAVAVGAWGNAV